MCNCLRTLASIAYAVLIFFVIPTTRVNAAPFQNGSFESPTATSNEMALTTSGLLPLTTLAGWTATSSTSSQSNQNVVITSVFDHVASGNQAVILNGDGLATTTLSQTFDTIVGTEYVVGFMLSAQTLGINFSQSNVSDAHLTLGVTGNLAQTFADPTVASSGVFPYVGEQYLFIATTTASTMTFTQSDGTDISPMIDSVTVTSVPEPLSGVVLIALAPLGFRPRRLRPIR